MTFSDIAGAQVDWGGSLISGPFTIAEDSRSTPVPCSSSPISGTELTAVAFVARALRRPVRRPRHHGRAARRIDGAADGRLMTLENSATASQDQLEPSIDSDGTHFLVAYSEAIPRSRTPKCSPPISPCPATLCRPCSRTCISRPGFGQDQRTSNVAAARAPGTLDAPLPDGVLLPGERPGPRHPRQLRG